MDIQKEREAFERLPLAELAIKCEYVYYNEKTNSYYPNEDFCPDSAPETMNFAWQAWQAAKSQAIPEGFVLVPKEPTPKMFDAADNCAIDGKVTANIVYKAMIEAQEPANE